MRFAFVLTNLAGGGAEKAVLKIAAALLEEGHAASIVLLEDLVEHQVPDGVIVRPLLPAGRLKRGWLGKRLLARGLSRLVSDFTPDVVISTLPFADEVASLARLPRHWCRIANTLSERSEEHTSELQSH